VVSAWPTDAVLRLDGEGGWVYLGAVDAELG